jgi:hypothetical protein
MLERASKLAVVVEFVTNPSTRVRGVASLRRNETRRGYAYTVASRQQILLLNDLKIKGIRTLGQFLACQANYLMLRFFFGK